MSASRSITLPYADRFAEIETSLPGGGAGWLSTLRRESISRFNETGLPSPKVEAWKYTNLNALAQLDLRPAGAEHAGMSVAVTEVPRIDGAHRLVFVNGRFRSDLSGIEGLPPGVELTTFAAAADSRADFLQAHLGQVAQTNGHAVVNLNTAFMGDGYVLTVPEGVEIEAPVHVVSAFVPGTDGAALAYHPRNLVVAGPGSRVTIIETHLSLVSDSPYWANPVGEISIGRDAEVRHIKIQEESLAASHLAFTRAHIEAGGHFDSFVMTVGAQLSRNEIQVILDGENGTCRLNGVYLLRGRQHADTTTWIDHAKPHCDSDEVYKGVLDDRAHGVFQGKITVRRDAQKTNGNQLNRTVLLSEKAEIDTKPELEIYADDVKCSHGATAGELDENSMFYMRSRGIPQKEARTLLIRSFVEETLEEVAQAEARTYMERKLETWLQKLHREGDAQ